MAAMQPEAEAPADTVVAPFEYRASDCAADVRLAGDWGAWAPAPMARMGGDNDDDSNNNTWTLDVALKPGPRHFKFVVDGVWCTSPSYDTADDGQGGLNNFRVVAPDGPNAAAATAAAPAATGQNGNNPVAEKEHGEEDKSRQLKKPSAHGPEEKKQEQEPQTNCLLM